MPIIPANLTLFKSIQFLDSIYICQNVTDTETMGMSNIRLTAGTTSQPFRDIDEKEITYKISGPCLIYGSSPNPSPADMGSSVPNSNFINDGGGSIYDVPGLLVNILGIDPISNSDVIQNLAYPDEMVVLSNGSLTFGQDGLKADVTIKGRMGLPPVQTLSFAPTTPIRESNFYDFNFLAILKDTVDKSQGYTSSVINALLRNCSVSFNLDYINMDYIGKTQSKLYSYNGGTMKWEFDFVYDTRPRQISVTRQDNFYIDQYNLVGEELVPYFANHRDSSNGVDSSGAISTLVPDFTQCGLFYTGKQSSFGDALCSLFNNYISTSPLVYGLGHGQTNIVTNVQIERSLPLSYIKISGERIFR